MDGYMHTFKNAYTFLILKLTKYIYRVPKLTSKIAIDAYAMKEQTRLLVCFVLCKCK